MFASQAASRRTDALTRGAVVEHRRDVEWDDEFHGGEILRLGNNGIQKASGRHRKKRLPCLGRGGGEGGGKAKVVTRSRDMPPARN